MSAKQAVHTFQMGMVKDLDKSLISKERYLDAHNIRLITSVGESTGGLENIEGNNNISTALSPCSLQTGHRYIVVKGTATYNSVAYTLGQIFTVLSSPIIFTGAGAMVSDLNAFTEDDMYVVGSVTIRDTIVLFLTSNTTTTPTTGHSKIVKFKIDASTESFTDFAVVYDDNLNNSAGYLKFSTAYPIRSVGAYETPTIQKIYWCDGYNNMRYANITDSLTTDKDPYSVGVNYYFQPDLFEFIPEALLHKPILDRLSPGAIKAGVVQYAFQYFNNHGAETSISPLSNTIHITTDNDYLLGSYYYKGEADLSKTTGKSVRMTFTTPDSAKYSHIRVIRLHYETINSVPTITVVGEVPLTSSPATISYLDTGATSYGTYTLDELNLGHTELFGAKDLTIKDERLFASNITKEEFSIGDWDARAVRFNSSNQALVTDTAGNVTINQTFTNWSSYLPDHDGINPYNDPYNDGNATYAYKFQSNGSTLGAEGPNIKIGFTTDTINLDNNNSGNVFSAGTEDQTDNKSYTSFASPYMSGRKSWQRDEVYRLYIVFFNAHGIASPAKWVCDLRMPSLHDNGYHALSVLSGSNINTTALYPTVKLNSFPTGAVSAQLLRMERQGDDRSILTQALVIPVGSVSAASRPRVMTNTIAATGNIVKLVSPEINVTKNISKGSSDYLEYVTYYPSCLVTGNAWLKYYKCDTNALVAYSDSTKATIDDALYVEPRSNTNTFSFNATTCANYDSATSALGCSGLFVHHTNDTWAAEGVSLVVVNYKRDVHVSQYGGQSFESREGNIAIPASDIITSTSPTYTAWNGDTFINFFDVSTQLADLTKTYNNTLNENVFVPLESSVNCDLRHDRSSSKAALDAYNYNIQEVAGKWTNLSGDTYDQKTSLYQYNTVYSQESNAKFYVNVPTSVSTDTEFDCMVKVSKTKINGEAQDSFTLFPINDFIEVQTNHGPITTLSNVNDKLLFWQENAFGVLSVNDRSLVQDSGGAALVLGTGGVLDRYDYVSDKVGSTNNQHVVASQSGVYWLNTKDKSIYRFTNALENITKSKQMQSWFEERLSPANLQYNVIRTVYDKRYNQVLMSFYNTSTANGVTLSFDENIVIDSFSSFYDYYTYKFIPFNEGYLSTNHVYSNDLLFYHNSLIKDRCVFHSYIPGVAASETLSASPKYKDSTIKVVFNDDYGYTKAFDNLSIVSTVTSNNIEIYNRTFNSIRCYNNYQNTDYCDLVYGTNLERDEREWTTFVPRNAVNKNYDTNPDVFAAANLDKTRMFNERIREKYMITDFTFVNTSNQRLVVPYVTVKYRVSYR